MRIAYIVPALRNKGPVLVVKELVEQMVKNGQECTVFYFDDIAEMSLPCPVFRISFFSKIAFERFDIVHSHGIRPDNYVLFHKPWRGNTRFVTTLHSYVIRDLSYQYNKPVGYLCGNWWIFSLFRHDKVVTLSRDAKSYYRRWISRSRLAYVYNTRNICPDEELTPAQMKQVLDFKRDCVLIGVNALLSPVKGLDLLIRALPELPGYKLFIAGDGVSMNELVRLSEEYKVRDRVLFAGYQEDAYRYLPYYDVYAMPSRSEGFPLALLEAAIAGIPVVCSDLPIFKEIFTNEEAAFFTLEDVASLCRAVECATHNSGMARRVRQKYLDAYSPEILYKRYLDIYQSLL